VSRRVVLLVLASVWAVAAFGAAGAAIDRDEWVEEVLLQLSEMRKAQAEMRKAQDEMREAQGAMRAELTELSAVVDSLRGADPVRRAVTIDLRAGSYPVLGRESATIGVIEFSDFECPFCRRHAETTLPVLAQKYIDTGKIRYFFVDFPLDMHPNAESAAVAGACAQAEGAFWEMRAALFGAQSALDEQTYTRLAADLDLDAKAFAACRRDPRVIAAVRERVRLGESLGVRGTPAFFIGRVRDGLLQDAVPVGGAQPVAVFEEILDAFLDGPAS